VPYLSTSVVVIHEEALYQMYVALPLRFTNQSGPVKLCARCRAGYWTATASLWSASVTSPPAWPTMGDQCQLCRPICSPPLHGCL